MAYHISILLSLSEQISFIMNHLKIVLFSFLLILSGYRSMAQETGKSSFDCFSVLAGKNATIDGSVMFAHNEDDYGDRIVNWYKVPQLTHTGEEMITMKNGGAIPQVKETWSYLWLEMPEMEFSDSYMNEWGVTIGSDACSSREKKGELTDGGIGYWLRRAMAERAKTAREAVKIGGALVEQFGYTSSGRTYCIADPNEAWMLAVVNGKHWVAERIPDDEVAIIPNYYTITTIDLADTMNYYGSSDLVEYAKTNKWYNPNKDTVFNFREAYSDPGNLKNMGNIVRHWSSINILAENQYEIDDEFPFSFKPGQKVDLNILFSVLRNHNEGTEYDKTENYTKGNPHENGQVICSATTQYGFVAQLRANMPKEVGAVLWLAPFRPCVHPFTPWYEGMTDMPIDFAIGGYRAALSSHFEPIENLGKFAPDHKFLLYVKDAKSIDRTYGKQIKQIQKNLSDFENDLIDGQSAYEKRLIEIYAMDRKEAEKMMTDYSEKQIQRSLEMLK